jgi:hypothetical protein
VLSLCFSPSLERRGNRPPIVGYKGQPLSGGFLQADRIVLPQEFSVFPFGHTKNYQQPITTAKTFRDRRRDMLVQEKLEHLTSLRILWK